MYEAITGVVVAVSSDSIIIGFGENKESVIGFSYRVITANPTKYNVDEKVSLLLYHQKGDYGDNFYGFASPKERQFFNELMSADKVGPKAALNIMALGTVDDIKQAIRMGNAMFLQRARGVNSAAKGIILKLGQKYANEHFESSQNKLI